MIVRLLVAPLVVLGMAFAPIDAVGQQWETVRAPDDSFLFELPGKPTLKKQPMKMESGVVFTKYEYDFYTDTSSYTVLFYLYPENLRVNFENMTAAAPGKTWRQVKRVTRQGAPAQDAVLDDVVNRTVVRSLKLAVGNRYIELMYIGDPHTERGPRVERFIESLKLGPQLAK
jgi:hypothetical protein